MQKDFEFTEELINRVMRLNDLLRTEEQRVRTFAMKTIWSLKEFKSLGTIDDYNFDTTIMVFSDNEECNNRNNVEEGNPIYKDYFTIFREETDECFFTDDWNELDAEHPLRHIPFCYALHCIYSHSDLTWEDIVQIDTVWIDVKVDFQFMIDYPQKKGATKPKK